MQIISFTEEYTDRSCLPFISQHLHTTKRLQWWVIAACQHAISPPFGHWNSQGRAGHCCSPQGVQTPTWLRRSLNTPTIQRLKSSIPLSLDTPHWGTKGKRKRRRRGKATANSSSSKRRKQLQERVRRKRKSHFLHSSRGSGRQSLLLEAEETGRGRVLRFPRRVKQVCSQAHTWTQRRTRTCTPLLLRN